MSHDPASAHPMPPLTGAPALTGIVRSAQSEALRRLVPALVVGLLLLGFVFNREVVAAVETWTDSTAYNHCFLIIPIALYLLWDRHRDLVGIPAAPRPSILLLGVPLGALWLAAERLGIMEGRQLVAVGFIELLFLAVLGTRLWWAMAGPLMYLYFLVPFGEFLTPKLQDVTTFFVRWGLELFGIPAYIDGYVIEIPQGTFFVAEACAGLRFLIASVAFGCLYALVMYRSPMRRGIFILASVIVPIVANGIRGLGIVSLGYILGSAQAAAADHILYGWIFFSLVILMLIGLGLPFRQDGDAIRHTTPAANHHTSVALARGPIAISVGLFLVASVSPLLAAALTAATTTQVAAPQRIDLGSGCVVHPAAQPAGASTGSQRVACGAVLLDMNWATFSPRSTAAPVMAARRRMVAGAITEGLQEAWLDTPGGSLGAWRLMKSNDPAYAIAVSVWVEGKPVRPGLPMRLRMALSSLTGSAFAPMVVSVTPVVNWRTGNQAEIVAAEDALPRFLAAHPELDATIGALSALP